MEEELPDFPVTEEALAAVEHALGYYLEEDPEARERGDAFPFRGAGAEYNLISILEFYAGVHGNPGRLLPEGEWINNVPTTVHEQPTYLPKDVIQALINEVRRLRALNTEESVKEEEGTTNGYVLDLEGIDQSGESVSGLYGPFDSRRAAFDFAATKTGPHGTAEYEARPLRKPV